MSVEVIKKCLKLNQTEIYHYGMPRRSGRYPWGSGDRPYQSVKDALKGKRRSNYFTSDRTIPKGTKVFRTTINPDERMSKNRSTYITYTEADRDLYRGGHIKQRDKKDAYEYEMHLKEDLKIPSRKTYLNAISEVIDKKPELLKESVDSYLNMLIPEKSWDRFEITTNVNTGEIDESLWNKFLKESYDIRKDIPVKEQWGSIAVSLKTSSGLKNEIIKDLRNNGYNAMVDEAGVGGSGRMIEGIDPLIIFDSSILTVDSISKVSNMQEKKSKKRLRKMEAESISKE